MEQVLKADTRPSSEIDFNAYHEESGAKAHAARRNGMKQLNRNGRYKKKRINAGTRKRGSRS
jgi:hypothetical protein